MDKENPTAKVKMSGYLHLKKKRMMSSWKNYWFVLEDRLLLYYHSKAEYDAISPCKGSINLGPPCTVKSLPSVTNAFQIETRTVTYTLRADTSDYQKKWIQAILSALNQNQNFSYSGLKKLNHFRYSLDNLVPEVEPNDQQVFQRPKLERQNTLPQRIKNEKENKEIIQRLQKIGAQSYGGSLDTIAKIATKKCESPAPLSEDANESLLAALQQQSEEVSKDNMYGENIYERISEQDSTRDTFIVDNKNYSVPLRKSPENEAVAQDVFSRETKSLIVENENYGVTKQVHSEEVIYHEPKLNIDYNENSVKTETFYASADIFNSPSTENLYEDLDTLQHYSQPKFKQVKDSSQSSVENNEVNKNDKSNNKTLKKSKSFIMRVWKKRKNKRSNKEDKSSEEDLYAEVDSSAVEKVAVNDESAIQMLSELQNILENKKTQIKERVSAPPLSQAEKEDNKPLTPTSESEVCPTLPPKINKKSQSVEQVRSLDEILDDLDKEKVESKTKVQMLIEKFSEPEVVLRKHDDFRANRHSDDLNVLLDELAKVTSAPILTPGVTSSLVNPNLTDEEWLKLLPVRQRRLSEPDYDVPRVHKSIQLPIRSEQENLDVIPATRFFGPVLSSTDTENKENGLLNSITPDSLEVEEYPENTTNSEVSQHVDTLCSYTSHNYNSPNAVILKTEDEEKVIYALPKSYVSVATHIVNTCQNFCGSEITDECTIVYKSVKNVDLQEEVFKDSLEPNIVSTEF